MLQLMSITTQGSYCGDEGTRTHDLCLAKAPLSQLSYIPVRHELVGLRRLELLTSRLSGVRSNQAELQAHGS